MNTDLTDFLTRHRPFSETTAVWGDGAMPLRERHYFCRELPPLEYVTSVRSLVIKGEQVLVLKNRDVIHLFPGGRREQGETLEETLRREILEEAGWAISNISLVGFMHFHHLNPEPPGYRYPYPDFLQLIYISEAGEFLPASRHSDDYEIEAHFYPIDRLDHIGVDDHQLRFLNAALGIRMSDAVSIRRAGPDDAGILAALNRDFNDSDVTSAYIASRLRTGTDDETVLVAEVADHVVGFACVRMMVSVCYSDRWAELTELYVQPAHRRQGVGRALIREAERLALDRGATEMHLYTGVKNAAGKALYRALAYREKPEVLFRKRLGAS